MNASCVLLLAGCVAAASALTEFCPDAAPAVEGGLVSVDSGSGAVVTIAAMDDAVWIQEVWVADPSRFAMVGDSCTRIGLHKGDHCVVELDWLDQSEPAATALLVAHGHESVAAFPVVSSNWRAEDVDGR